MLECQNGYKAYGWVLSAALIRLVVDDQGQQVVVPCDTYRSSVRGVRGHTTETVELDSCVCEDVLVARHISNGLSGSCL